MLQGREAQPAQEEPVYRVVIRAVLRLPEAIMRMRRMLAEAAGPMPLEAFVPEVGRESRERGRVRRLR